MVPVNDDSDSADSEPLIQREPKLGQRFKHILGIHSWETVTGPGRTREYCLGCHQERNAVTRFRPPVDFPPQTPPEPDQPASPDPEQQQRQQPPPPREETRDSPFTHGRQKQSQGDFQSAWQWFVGLRLWVKIFAGFMIFQLIGVVVGLFTGST